jgi:uncharacterized lipoprotein YajG
MKSRQLRLSLIAVLLLGLVILTGCTTPQPVTLPTPPPCRYEATTQPVGVVDGQIVYLSL